MPTEREAVTTPLKLKYTAKKDGKRGKYRPRTGPRCCTSNCPSMKKKGKKVHRKPVNVAQKK